MTGLEPDGDYEGGLQGMSLVLLSRVRIPPAFVADRAVSNLNDFIDKLFTPR